MVTRDQRWLNSIVSADGKVSQVVAALVESGFLEAQVYRKVCYRKNPIQNHTTCSISSTGVIRYQYQDVGWQYLLD